MAKPHVEESSEEPGPGDWIFEGHPRFLVVIADDPTPVAVLSAEELVLHVELATGVKVPVVKESEVESPSNGREVYPHRLYLGNTSTAHDAGLEFEKLGPDEFVMRSIGPDLFIGGKELSDFDARMGGRAKDLWEFLSNPPWSGTLHGVYEFLGRWFGVRWLWPGELGTHVPKAGTVSLPEVDETSKPAFAYRSFTPRLIEPSREDAYSFLQRHRINAHARPVPMHTFEGWWTKLGEKHPDWFMMNARGERGGGRGKHVPINPASEGLRNYILNEAWDGGNLLDLSEVDSTDFSLCPESMSMDSSKADSFRPQFSFQNRVVSDRYAKFWKEMHERAAERNPDVKVTTFLYWQTFHAPLDDIELSPAIHGEFTPWMRQTQFVPMPQEALDHIKEQWLGWKKTGMTMAFRPNYFWGGYVMPFLSTRQVGELFKFTAEHGSIGFHGDSLIGHWATQGPMLYLHMRLLTDPDLDVEEIRREYLSGFGPAAEAIGNYWDFWESYSHELVDRLYQENARQWPSWGINELIDAPKHYPPEAFKRGFDLLAEAEKATEVPGDEVYRRRVDFLTAGLRHAQLAANFLTHLDEGSVPVDDRERFEKARLAWLELQEFRDQHSDQAIINRNHLNASTESRIKNLAALQGTFDEIESTPGEVREKAASSFAQWQFRQDPSDIGEGAFWAVPGEDDTDWNPIAVPAPWNDYRGVGWYRTRFFIPEAWAGEPIRLDFEGIYGEQIGVFINGHRVRQRTLASNDSVTPSQFSVDIPPDILEAGAVNSLVIRLLASGEVAGIVGPVSGYRPHPEDWMPIPPFPQE